MYLTSYILIYCNNQISFLFFFQQVEVLKKIIEILVNASLPIPRYFFQILQSTSVKLAISPQPRVLGEFISVQAGSQLAVKVEGVIQHGIRPGLFRKIKEVVINVTSQLQNNPKNKEVIDPKVGIFHSNLLGILLRSVF